MRKLTLISPIILLLLIIFLNGFSQDTRPASVRTDSLAIKPKDSIKELKEVKISGAKKLFTVINGNIRVNIENSVLSSIPNTIDLLVKLPGLQLSPDGEQLNLAGKGTPLLYLDNQQIKMVDLASLSTNDIKTIEIINHPSSKYEAAGRAVILITLKKNKSYGLKIDLAETAAFKTYYQNRSSVNASFKQGKLEFKGNIQYNYLNLWESNSNDFLVTHKNLESAYTVTSIGLRQQTIIDGGIYYQINDNDYLSFNSSKRFQHENFTIATQSFLQDTAKEDHVVTNNFNQDNRPFYNSSLNYSKKLKDTGGELFIGAQYSRYHQALNSNIWNNYNDTQNVFSQSRQQQYLIEVLSGRADFEKAFKNEMKLENGISLSSANSNALLDIESYGSLSTATSNYDYREKIYAAYTQLSGKIKKVSYTAGLRFENTRVQAGYHDSIPPSVHKNYVNLFPKASVNFPLGTSKSFILAYAESISRPNYSTSSKITTYVNPFFEWSNNINISPSIKKEISATVQHRENTFGISYYRINNPVYFSAEYNGESNVLRMIDKNYALESGVNITMTIPFKSGLWSSTNMLVATKDQVKDPAAIMGKSRPYVYFYSNHQFKLPAACILMVSGWGITKRNEGIFQRNAGYAIDTAVTKTFFNKLNCSLGYNSLLSTGQVKENFDVNGVTSKGIYYLDQRQVSLSVKYAFGKLKDSAYKNKDVNDNMNRIR